ncbi:MAG: class I SAM-dependent methyltransferase [Anaerolineae bacterium]
MNQENQADLLQFWASKEQHETNTQHLGWDFTHLKDRIVEESHPWSYSELAKALLDQSTAIIDMGTAEGGRLLKLKEHWPAKVVVTEEHPPNFLLAKQNLEKHNVNVFDVRLTHTDSMPFEDREFDLVLNRHSAFNSNEVGRILAAGGVFLTQQIHGLWLADLMAIFGVKPQ